MPQALACLRKQLQAKLSKIVGGTPDQDMQQTASVGKHAAMALTYRAMQKRLASAGVQSLSQAIAHTLHSFSTSNDDASNDDALKLEKPAGPVPSQDSADHQVMQALSSPSIPRGSCRMRLQPHMRFWPIPLFHTHAKFPAADPCKVSSFV